MQKTALPAQALCEGGANGCRAASGRHRYITKTWLIMRLTIIFFIAGILQLQARGLAQTVTLNGKNLTLAGIFTEVKKQTGYVLVSSVELLQHAKPVTINVKNEPLESFIKQVLQGQSLYYTIENKTISIRRKQRTHFDDHINTGGEWEDIPYPVKGIVTDEHGNPLRGATVLVKNINKSVETDAEGKFSLMIDDGEVLVISFVGFEKKEFKVNARNLNNGALSVALKQSETILDEMVLKGYYTEQKRLSTGSVSKVSAKEISRQPVGNVMAALEGRMAGVAITQNSGLPGSNYVIQIRGQNSLRNTLASNYGNYPLYIVDGVPYPAASLNIGGVSALGSSSDAPNRGMSPLNSISPGDIESIEVLKDADATSIYGSRGANGVILITTKKGKAGKLKLDANVYAGAGTVERRIDLLQTKDYLAMRKQALLNDNVPVRANDYDINGAWDTTRNIDWQEELFGGTANVTNADMSVSGGNANTQFRISTGYRKETTVFPGDYSDQRGTVGLNLSTMSTNQRFKINMSVNYGYNETAMLFSDLTAPALRLAPNAPSLYDSLGNLNWQNNTFDNPLKNSQRPYKGKTSNLIASATISYELFKGLVLSTNLGYTNTTLREIGKTLKTYFNPQQAANQPLASIFGNSFANTWQVEPQANYSKEIGRGQLNILVGGAFQESLRDQTRISANGFADPSLMENIAFATQSTITSIYTYSKYNFNSVFGRVRYDWGNKYILNLTARRDGSTRFGPNKRFSDFGSVALAWIFSNEDFVRNNLSFLSFGKLRGSYGTTGSDQIPDYGFLDNYGSSGNYMGNSASSVVRLFNSDYSWEVNKKLEGALDLGFFNDKLFLTTSYYFNRSGNQLIGQLLPPTTGFTTIQSNLPAVVQNSGWELEARSTNVRTKDLTWTSSLNITFPKNKLISFPNLENTPVYSSLYVVGESVYISKLYHFTGIDPATGLYTIEDVNGDGFFDRNDMRPVFTGKYYFGGLSNTLTYRNFTLDVFFQFVKQRGTRYVNTTPGLTGNQPADVLDHWQKTGDDAFYQRYGVAFTSQTAFFNGVGSDLFLDNTSFIRWKNLAVSYTLPQQWTSKSKLTSLRLYFQAQNILTITRYKGLDPETTSFLPPLRTLTAGLQIIL